MYHQPNRLSSPHSRSDRKRCILDVFGKRGKKRTAHTVNIKQWESNFPPPHAQKYLTFEHQSIYHPPPGSHQRNVTRLHYLPANRGVQHASGTEKRDKMQPMFLQKSHQHATWTPCSTHRATCWLHLRHISTLPDTYLVAQWEGNTFSEIAFWDKKKSFFAEKSNREFVVRCFGVRISPGLPPSKASPGHLQDNNERSSGVSRQELQLLSHCAR